jgi:hypothetical protein
MSENETRAAGTPRWVKVFGVIAVVIVIVVVVMLVFGRGGHGPSRHLPDEGTGTTGSHTGPPTGVTHEQP